MKSNFIRFAVFATFLTVAVLFAGCTQISEDGGAGSDSNFIGGGTGGNGGGYPPNLPTSPKVCYEHDWIAVNLYLDEEYHWSYECSICAESIREEHTGSPCRKCSANGGSSGGSGGSGSSENAMEWNAPAKNVIPRLVILSKPVFKNALQPYVKHKTVQGFPITEIYTDSNSATEIRQQLITIYNKDPGKLMAVLIIGDGDDYYNKQNFFPTFNHTVSYNGQSHQTDFYFGEYTGDWIQEATVGRFPVKSSDDLKAITEKIIFMENEVAVGNAELKNFLAVNQSNTAGTEFSTAKKHAENFGLNVTSLDVTAASSINSNINSGVGFVFYAGHGYPNTWANIYTIFDVKNLTNTTSYPVVVASTCLSGKYENLDSICKDFVNKKDGGAIAYIGASNESYFPPNRVLTTGIQRSTYVPGLITGMYYDDSYEEKYKARNLGELMHIGQNATRNYLTYIGSMTKHQLEIYNLMGDPTYMPYTDTPKQININCRGNVTAGSSITVNTGAPYAQVALTQADSSATGGIKIVDAVIAGASGEATLNVDSLKASTGQATLYAIAKNYRGGEVKVDITND